MPMEDADLPETCALHDCELVEGAAPLLYGLIGTSPEYGRAFRYQFRYSRSWSAGGCSTGANRPKTEVVQYCPHCRDLERKWLTVRLSEAPAEDSWEQTLNRLIERKR